MVQILKKHTEYLIYELNIRIKDLFKLSFILLYFKCKWTLFSRNFYLKFNYEKYDNKY